MPWRTRRTPYRVLVSEIMLQQTTVATVMPRFPVFVRRFPSFRALSRAPVAEVVAAWKGLGYNRRALALRECARIVAERFGGRLPRSAEELMLLPGIGKATAAAVIVYAFDLPRAFIETNIRRVFLHYFFPGRARVADSKILPLVEQTIDRRRPREWFYALMDLGAWLGSGKGGREAARAARRSTRYRRQGSFEGSLRQLRGRILAALIARGSCTKAQFVAAIGGDERLEEALAQLVDEGFLRRAGAQYAFK